MGFNSLMTSPSRGVPLVAFFPIKCVTSLIVFAALLADTGESRPEGKGGGEEEAVLAHCV